MPAVGEDSARTRLTWWKCLMLPSKADGERRGGEVHACVLIDDFLVKSPTFRDGPSVKRAARAFLFGVD